jgi:hypothetical protein
MARVSTSAASTPEGSKKPAKSGKKKGKTKAAPSVSDALVPVAPPAPTNRVTIALPFSQIRLQEPSQELTDLVALVGDLLGALRDTLSTAQHEEFEAQVDSLRARLR